MAWFRCEHTIQEKSRDFEIRKALTTIGRSSGNDLVLDDPMVGQTHASVMRKSGVFTLSLTDRSSQIYVNGRRVRTKELAEGDQVLLGAWKLTYTEAQPEGGLNGPDTGLDVDALESLVALSAEMMRDTAPKRLFGTLLKGLVELTRAEKGFVIVLQDGGRHLAASHNVSNEHLDISKVSDSIVNQVVEHLKPVIVSDAMRDSRFGRAKSVVDLKLSSVMCVPLMTVLWRSGFATPRRGS